MKEESRRTRGEVAIKARPNAKREKQPAWVGCCLPPKLELWWVDRG